MMRPTFFAAAAAAMFVAPSRSSFSKPLRPNEWTR
jgi:hypothetical protein